MLRNLCVTKFEQLFVWKLHSPDIDEHDPKYVSKHAHENHVKHVGEHMGKQM